MYLLYSSIGSTAFCPLFSGLRILNLRKINPTTTTTPCQPEWSKTIQKIQTRLLKETAFALSKKPLGNPTIWSKARLKVQNLELTTNKIIQKQCCTAEPVYRSQLWPVTNPARIFFNQAILSRNDTSAPTLLQGLWALPSTSPYDTILNVQANGRGVHYL